MRVLSGDRKKGFISGFIVWMTVLVVIVMVALWFAARSERGRVFVESNISKRLGMKVSIESMHIGLPYVLVVENLRTAEFEAAGTPGFSAAEVRLWRGFNYWNIKLKQLIMRLKDDEKGSWTPVQFVRLGDLKDADIPDIVRLTEDIRKKVRLRISNSNIEWLNESGAVIASAVNVDFRMLPVHIDERKMHYYLLNIYNASGITLNEGRDMHWEWLTTPKTDYIELPGRDNEENDEAGMMKDEDEIHPVAAEPEDAGGKKEVSQ